MKPPKLTQLGSPAEACLKAETVRLTNENSELRLHLARTERKAEKQIEEITNRLLGLEVENNGLKFVVDEIIICPESKENRPADCQERCEENKAKSQEKGLEGSILMTDTPAEVENQEEKMNCDSCTDVFCAQCVRMRNYLAECEKDRPNASCVSICGKGRSNGPRFSESRKGKPNDPRFYEYMKIADSRIDCLQILVRKCKRDKEELEKVIRGLQERLPGASGDAAGVKTGESIKSQHDLSMALKTAKLQLNILQRRNIDLEQQLKNSILTETQHYSQGRKKQKEVENAMLEGLLSSDSACLGGYPSAEEMSLEEKNRFLEAQLSHCCQEKAKLKYLLEECRHDHDRTKGRYHAALPSPARPSRAEKTTELVGTRFNRVSSKRSGAGGRGPVHTTASSEMVKSIVPVRTVVSNLGKGKTESGEDYGYDDDEYTQEEETLTSRTSPSTPTLPVAGEGTDLSFTTEKPQQNKGVRAPLPAKITPSTKMDSELRQDLDKRGTKSTAGTVPKRPGQVPSTQTSKTGIGLQREAGTVLQGPAGNRSAITQPAISRKREAATALQGAAGSKSATAQKLIPRKYVHLQDESKRPGEDVHGGLREIIFVPREGPTVRVASSGQEPSEKGHRRSETIGKSVSPDTLQRTSPAGETVSVEVITIKSPPRTLPLGNGTTDRIVQKIGESLDEKDREIQRLHQQSKGREEEIRKLREDLSRSQHELGQTTEGQLSLPDDRVQGTERDFSGAPRTLAGGTSRGQLFPQERRYGERRQAAAGEVQPPGSSGQPVPQERFPGERGQASAGSVQPPGSSGQPVPQERSPGERGQASAGSVQPPGSSGQPVPKEWSPDKRSQASAELVQPSGAMRNQPVPEERLYDERTQAAAGQVQHPRSRGQSAPKERLPGERSQAPAGLVQTPGSRRGNTVPEDRFPGERSQPSAGQVQPPGSPGAGMKKRSQYATQRRELYGVTSPRDKEGRKSPVKPTSGAREQTPPSFYVGRHGQFTTEQDLLSVPIQSKRFDSERAGERRVRHDPASEFQPGTEAWLTYPPPQSPKRRTEMTASGASALLTQPPPQHHPKTRTAMPISGASTSRREIDQSLSMLPELRTTGVAREAVLEREILSLRGSIGALQREQEGKIRQLENKERDLAQSQSESEQQRRHIADLEVRLKASELKLRDDEETKRRQEMDLALLRRQLETGQRDFETLNREREDMMRKVRDISTVSTLTELDRQTLKHELDKKNDEIGEFKAKLQRYVDEVRRIEELLGWKEEENQQLLSQYTSLKSDFSELETAQVNLERQSDTARTTFKATGEENGALKRQLCGQAALLKSYERQIQRLTQQVSELTDKIASASEAGHTLESDSKTLHASHTKLEGTLDSVRLELANCESRSKLIEAEREDLLVRNAELDKVLTMESENINRLHEIVETYRETKELQDQRIEKLEEEKNLLEDQVIKLMDRNDKLHDEIKHWRLKFVETTQELDTIRRMLENEKMERESVLDELKSLRQQLSTSSTSMLLNSALYSRGSATASTPNTGRSLGSEPAQAEGSQNTRSTQQQ